jgi:hypothetical protein
MGGEREILLDMDKTLTNLFNSINNTISQMNVIDEDIRALDNNYFLEERDQIWKKMLELFNADNLSIHNLTNTISTYEKIVSKQIASLCEHEWIRDEIDITPDTSRQICYCRKCEISKKI